MIASPLVCKACIISDRLVLLTISLGAFFTSCKSDKNKDKPINRFNIVENSHDNNQTDKYK